MYLEAQHQYQKLIAETKRRIESVTAQTLIKPPGMWVLNWQTTQKDDTT